MRKILIMIILVSSVSVSQSKPILSLSNGISRSKIKIVSSNNRSQYISFNIPSFSIDALLEIPFDPNLSIEFGLYSIIRGGIDFGSEYASGKWETYETKIKAISLPVHLKLYKQFEKFSFYSLAGPSFTYHYSMKETYSAQFRTETYDVKDVKKYDFGNEVGAGVNMHLKYVILFAEYDYYFSLLNLWDNKDLDATYKLYTHKMKGGIRFFL